MKRNLKRNLKKKLEKRSTSLAKAFPAKGVKVEERKEEERQAEDEEGDVEDEADEEESDKPSEDRDILNTRLYYGIKLNFFCLFISKIELIEKFVVCRDKNDVIIDNIFRRSR